ncbi:MAG: DUF2505 family protein [Polyangiaceae bacterium]|nr:DUF2505 family protein [Polyangiaceae bacterium]
MRNLDNRHTFACDVDTFWRVFLDPAFNRELFLKALAFQKFEVVAETETSRTMRATPKVNMPKPVAALFGDGFSYEEQGRLEGTPKVWRWKIVTKALGEKFRNEGTVRAEPAGEGKCTRIDTLTLEAKVFGIGGLIEGTAEKEARAGWGKTNALMERWLREQVPTGAG